MNNINNGETSIVKVSSTMNLKGLVVLHNQGRNSKMNAVQKKSVLNILETSLGHQIGQDF